MTHSHSLRTTVATLVSAATLALAPVALAEEAHIYLAPHVWSVEPGGNAVADSFDDDLHYALDFHARLGRHRIIAGASSGENTSDPLNATIELDRARAFYGFSFVNMSLVDFGGMIGLNSYKATFVQPGPDSDIDSPAPSVGVNFGIRPPIIPIRLYVEAVVSSGEFSGVDTKLTDAHASFDWYLIPIFKTFGVQVGYRYYDLDAEDKDTGLKFEAKFKGPYAGLVFRF